MVATVPVVTNWSVTPQNGQVGYFTLMNTWLFESTSVIASLNSAINKINEAGQDINDIGANAINAITFDNIAQLRLNSNMGRADVLGYYTKGDGGGGLFYWDSTSTETDDGGYTIQATGMTMGRWKRPKKGVVNVKEFGTKDYLIAPTFDNSTIINSTYIYCVNNSVKMVIEGNYYIEHSLIFSLRAGISSQYMILANCTIFSNIANTSPALYIGDDSSNGVYKLNIDGMIIVKNISGVKRGIGFHLQSAAYGYYNVVSQGFDFGFKLEGAIFVTIDGKNGTTSENNVDIVIEPNLGAQGGLRHTNNVSKFTNMSLNSSNKILMRAGDGFAVSGGILQFNNILFEGDSASDYENEATIICSNTAETSSGYLGKVHFINCWFEGCSNNKPIINAYSSDVIVDYSFITNNFNVDNYFKIDSNSSLHFNNCTGNFSDEEPIALVGSLSDGDITYRGQIFLNNTHFYGITGTCIPLHNGISSLQSDLIKYFRGDGNTTTISMRGKAERFPSDSINDYMQDGTINITSFLNNFIGDNWQKFTLYISGSDGGSVNSVKIEGCRIPGPQTYNYTTLLGTGLTTSDHITFSFPNYLSAGWYRPYFLLEANSISGAAYLVI